MARMLVGSAPDPAVDLSASEAASSSMNSGLPSAVSATVSARAGRLEPLEEQRRELPRVVSRQRIEWECRVGGKPTGPAGTLVQELRSGEREEEHRHVANARGERLEQVEQAGVGPVDVLEQEQRRPFRAQGLHEDARREEEGLAVRDVAVFAEPEEQREVRGMLGRRLGADDLGDRRVELRASLGKLVAVVRLRDLLHVLRERAVRARRAIRRRPSSQQTRPPATRRAP